MVYPSRYVINVDDAGGVAEAAGEVQVYLSPQNGISTSLVWPISSVSCALSWVGVWTISPLRYTRPEESPGSTQKTCFLGSKMTTPCFSREIVSSLGTHTSMAGE